MEKTLTITKDELLQTQKDLQNYINNELASRLAKYKCDYKVIFDFKNPNTNYINVCRASRVFMILINVELAS